MCLVNDFLSPISAMFVSLTQLQRQAARNIKELKITGKQQFNTKNDLIKKIATRQLISSRH